MRVGGGRPESRRAPPADDGGCASCDIRWRPALVSEAVRRLVDRGRHGRHMPQPSAVHQAVRKEASSAMLHDVIPEVDGLTSPRSVRTGIRLSRLMDQATRYLSSMNGSGSAPDPDQ